MPVTPTYPGVYIEEIPSSVRPIAGVLTSIGAFIDDFLRGPRDAAVQLLGMSDFERVYGGLSATSEASYAIQQFFLNGGTSAWVVRVCEDTDADPQFAAVTATGQLEDDGGATLADLNAGRRVRGSDYEDPGAWGNGVRIDVDYATSDPTASFNLTVSEVVVDDGRARTARSETFRNLVFDATDAHDVVDVVNEASAMLHVALNGTPAATDRPAMTGTISGQLGANTPNADVAIVDITVTAGNGNTFTSGAINVPFLTLAATATWDQARAVLETALQSVDPTVDASRFLREASVQLVEPVTGQRHLRVLLSRPEVLLDPDLKVEFDIPTGDTVLLDSGAATANAQQLSLTGGVDGTPPRPAHLIGSRSLRTGMFALEEADLFNLFCIPRAAELDDAPMDSVVSAATAYCEERRSFMLVDIPADVVSLDDMQAFIAAHDTLRHRNLAMYWPRPQISDPLRDGRLRSTPASGTVAGLYARTDVERGVWKAPAGTEAALRGVSTLDFQATDAQNGVLNPIGVNVLRTFPVYGTICWGSRTLDGADVRASQWKYVPVRRTALYLEESLFRGLKWVVFEPNDEPLWAQIRLNVGAFMQGLFRKGAFQGKSSREAYLVKCDSETTTQADIDLGVVNIVVGFAPLKPAEFVILQIQQLAGKIEI